MSNIYIPPLIVILMKAMDINTELHVPMREFEYRYTFFDMIGDISEVSSSSPWQLWSRSPVACFKEGAGTHFRPGRNNQTFQPSSSP